MQYLLILFIALLFALAIALDGNWGPLPSEVRGLELINH